MKATLKILSALLVLGLAAPAFAQTIRDHRRAPSRAVKPPHAPTTRYAPAHPRAPRTAYAPAYRSNYRYVNGLWVYDTPAYQPITDPMWFRYPGVAAPRGPVEIVYDASGGFMWIAGYWDWTGARWIWIDGFWEPVRSGYYWEPGHWEIYDRRPVRRSGHWAPTKTIRDHRRFRRSTTAIRRTSAAPAKSRFRRH